MVPQDVCEFQTRPRLAWWRTTTDLSLMYQKLWYCDVAVCAPVIRLLHPQQFCVYHECIWITLVLFYNLSLNVVVQVGILYFFIWAFTHHRIVRSACNVTKDTYMNTDTKTKKKLILKWFRCTYMYKLFSLAKRLFILVKDTFWNVCIVFSISLHVHNHLWSSVLFYCMSIVF